MPECLLFAYVDEMPRIRAEQLRELSFAAAWAHMTKQGAKDWMDSLQKAMQRVVTEGISWNGKPVSMRGLRSRLASALGSGFSDR